MPKLHRKDDGKPIRDAMARAGLSIPALAEATRRVDPDGKGVSAATVGRLAGQGKTARENCELRTAWLVADALHTETCSPLQDLFAMPAPSTSNIERSTPDAEEE
ncbi:XRE family transcriptional regulator [Streptomyces sp. NPDC006172]|uniref:XRE family transcriptional regulator n=1 Tax=Streptomyces sp. NPDC006172 TaxID=3154470 RepID=UPI0033F7EEE2